jgi:hypothetical protein
MMVWVTFPADSPALRNYGERALLVERQSVSRLDSVSARAGFSFVPWSERFWVVNGNAACWGGAYLRVSMFDEAVVSSVLPRVLAFEYRQSHYFIWRHIHRQIKQRQYELLPAVLV